MRVTARIPRGGAAVAAADWEFGRGTSHTPGPVEWTGLTTARLPGPAGGMLRRSGDQRRTRTRPATRSAARLTGRRGWAAANARVSGGVRGAPVIAPGPPIGCPET
ncbi:hypothetical protein GCM10010274_42220 [Streptomyces lavendofoliae]|uniref:Uncharacterized protein n=1 Tax=Streptomyces lavendofoliae TaxID=67314 RepID=A0A918M5G4_9ACTN|nr:hypothetical protein GCM10010274_42220 [Streptomyces lavendofoliae]